MNLPSKWTWVLALFWGFAKVKWPELFMKTSKNLIWEPAPLVWKALFVVPMVVDSFTGKWNATRASVPLAWIGAPIPLFPFISNVSLPLPVPIIAPLTFVARTCLTL